MFGLFTVFAAPTIAHPALGNLRWSRGHWRGQLSLPGAANAPLLIDSGKRGPDEAALAEALAVTSSYPGWQARIAEALFEHSQPYAQAQAEGDDGAPPPANAAQSLERARLLAVVIAPLDGRPATELCYVVPWDEEHTLGARFRSGQWIELCGSTVVP